MTTVFFESTYSQFALFKLLLIFSFCVAVKCNDIEKLRNQQTIEGQQVTLQCPVPVNDSCRWAYAQSWKDIERATPIMTVPTDTMEYSVLADHGRCTLTIVHPTVDSPKVYACYANGGLGDPVYASLLVYRFNPICGRQLHITTATYTCIVEYSGDFGISMSWKSVDGRLMKQCNDSTGYVVCQVNDDINNKLPVCYTEVIKIKSATLPKNVDSSVPGGRRQCVVCKGDDDSPDRQRATTTMPSTTTSSDGKSTFQLCVHGGVFIILIAVSCILIAL